MSRPEDKKVGNKITIRSVQPKEIKGKERRYAEQVRNHPFKIPPYKLKTARRVKRNPVLPGNTVRASMLEECAVYIFWIIELQCSIPMNATYHHQVQFSCCKNCEIYVHIDSTVMVQFFTHSQNGRDVMISECVRNGRRSKKYIQ